MGVSLPKWVVITNIWAVIKARLGSDIELAKTNIATYKVSSTVVNAVISPFLESENL